MRDAGEMHDRVHAGEQGRPVDVSREIADLRGLDAVRKRLRAPHRRAHPMAGTGERGRERPADQAGRAGHQHLHRLPRAKVPSSQATSAPPSASVARSTRRSGSIALTSASVASARLSTNTRTTISVTENPPSVAR